MKPESKTRQMERNLDPLGDVVPEILCRLPVKSLMRCKCVSKSWYDLIKDPKFISKHLKSFNEINLQNAINFVVKHINGKPFVSLLSFDQEKNSFSLNHFDLGLKENQVVYLEIFGPCNGLYCLNCNPILLINPSMRKSRAVPKLDAPLTSDRHLGFGFDPKTNDYKVVMITQSWEKGTYKVMPWRAEIYSLNSTCWRKVDSTLPSSIGIPIWTDTWVDHFAQGAFHWWGVDSASGGDAIVAFDMVDEVFRTIRLPKVRSRTSRCAFDNDTNGIVAKFKETIAAIVYPRKGTEKSFDLWVMEDYGNEGSWSKHLTIGPIQGVTRPLLFWKTDQFLLEDDNGTMVSYNLQTQEIKNLKFLGEWGLLPAAFYMESLVTLGGDGEQAQAGVSFFNVVPDPLFDCDSGCKNPSSAG